MLFCIWTYSEWIVGLELKNLFITTVAVKLVLLNNTVWETVVSFVSKVGDGIPAKIEITWNWTLNFKFTRNISGQVG